MIVTQSRETIHVDNVIPTKQDLYFALLVEGILETFKCSKQSLDNKFSRMDQIKPRNVRASRLTKLYTKPESGLS